MTRGPCVLAAALSLLLASSNANMAAAQKRGGILKMGHFDSPASMSMLEESTQAVNRPMSGVFSNLVMFDQHVPQNVCARSCRTWRRAGPGTRRGPS
jgi:peptide/nickel transport system substrate-binding protein